MFSNMNESEISKEDQSISCLWSRIRKFCIYSTVLVLYIAVLSPSFLPTYFYFTSEKPEPRNATSGKNLTISSDPVGYDSSSGNSSHCNEPLIPQHLYNITVCVPQCGWTPLTKNENDQISATVYTACFIAIVSLIFTLTTWCKVQELWKFPHFIIVIMLAESTTIVTLVFVATLLEDDLFCSSKFLPEASKKSTTFCIIQGVLLHYLAGSIALWFVAYNVVVAKALAFDKLNARGNSKWPFVVSAAVSWLIPVIPVVIVLTSNDGYSSQFFAKYCFPSSAEMFYYTAVLPENVLYAIGISFLCVIVWKLWKERQAHVTASHDQAMIRKGKMDNVIKRLSLLMIFYSATIDLSYGSLAFLLNKEEALKISLTRYFYCLHMQPNCPSDYRNYVSHIPLVLNYIAAGIFPIATVLFLAANEKARGFWKRSFFQLRSRISQHESSDRDTLSSKLLNEDNEKQLEGKA